LLALYGQKQNNQSKYKELVLLEPKCFPLIIIHFEFLALYGQKQNNQSKYMAPKCQFLLVDQDDEMVSQKYKKRRNK